MAEEEGANPYLALPAADKGLPRMAGAGCAAPAASAKADGTAGKRIGLYGGSFNPPHQGHILVAETALERLGLDFVWWLVSPGNPLKDTSGLAPLAERIAASEALIAASPARALIRVSAFEKALERDYNIHGSAAMLAWLARENPQTHFVWLMGADNLADFHLWHNWREIMRLMPICVVDRPHFTAADKGQAAREFAQARLPETEAEQLAFAKPPAWLILHGRRSPLSSTQLRARPSARRR